jgi:hypothetical protein
MFLLLRYSCKTPVGESPGQLQWQQLLTVATDNDGDRLSAVELLAAGALWMQSLYGVGF